MIVGLVRADRSNSLNNGQDLTLLPMHGRAKKGIGYLPQEASIFRKLSGADNIMAILEPRKELDKAGKQAKAESLRDALHIQHIRDSKGVARSGGDRRREEKARARAAAPS